MVARQGVGPLFKSLNLVDEVFEVKKGDTSSYQILKKQLTLFEYEFIFCPHQSLRSALLTWNLKSRQKVGFASFLNFVFFSTRVKRVLNLPDALRQLSLLSPFSLELKNNLLEYSKKYSVQELGPVPAWASMDISEQVPENANANPGSKKYICLFPGSVWATKKWTEEGFINVGKVLSEQGFQIVLMGGQGEEELANRIASKVSGSISYANKTSILESLSILKRAKLTISNDSAGQHMASAVGTPVISIFGPTVISLGYRPWSEKSKIIEKLNLSCRPCGKHGHQVCPIKSHACMTGIEASEVLRAAQEVLSS